MKHWTSGYVDGVDYTFDYYRELTPSLQRFAALCRDHKFDLKKGMTYCELGCGQGFSTNLLAAGNPDIDFHANDFNPSHIAGATALAEEAQLTNVHFYEHAFADFINEPKLPESFDIIALHGIYSWISSENRGHIVNFISRKLRPGGLVYISYNALPGWSTLLPLRRIFTDHAATTSGPLPMRIGEALAFADSLREADAAYFKHSPASAAMLAQMKTQSRNYLAHEFFNRAGIPFYFADVVEELSAAKLSFIGSTDLNGHLDKLWLTDAQQEILDQQLDPVRREGIRDFLVNQQFRTDLFLKGPIAHSVRSGAWAWLETRFLLARPRASIPLKVKGRFGDVPLEPAIYEPVLDALADGPRSVRELLSETPVGSSVTWGNLTEAISLLVGAGHIQPCLPEADEEDRRKTCLAFNLAICNRAKDSETLRFMSSPVTGGGFQIDRFEQLFLLAIKEGHAIPDQWADYTWSILAPQGQKLLKDGKTLDLPMENLMELRDRARIFANGRLPVAKQFGITL